LHERHSAEACESFQAGATDARANQADVCFGIDAARRIQVVSPASKILFASENRSPDLAEKALSTGAGGYVVKPEAAGELLPAIRTVLEGKRFISASLAGHFLVATTLSATQKMHLSWIVTPISGIR
jgi:DNA-binding NarL/FixJ family response regulator